MKKISSFLLRCGLIAFTPVVANAAGTYYNNTYRQQPQARYNTGQTYSQSGGFAQYQGAASSYKRSGIAANPNAAYNARSGYANTGYGAYQNTNRYGAQNTATRNRNQANQPRPGAQSSGTGFWLDAGLSHEFATWQFEMKNAGSKLHYDNVGWNVFDARGGYAFNMGKQVGQIDVGVKYGMQFGESTMIDDDISNGGYLVDTWVEDVNNNGVYDPDIDEYIGDQIGHALSIGTSDGGSMLGFNVGFSLKDFFKVGNLRMTPSVGFRYLKYKLETKKNYGLAVDTAACFEVDGEIQCDPALVFIYADGKEAIQFRDDVKYYLQIPEGNPSYVDTVGTYYYEQPGVTHSYEVEWAGPYIAMDMDYLINQKNAVNGRVELGLPGYTATGDQPYRYDWEHPKSVEDKAGMFGAFHLGLGANYITALNDSVSLSFGFTFDYYTVSGADATTYFNQAWYEEATFNAYYNYYRRENYGDITDLSQEQINELTDLANAAVLDDPDLAELQAAGWKGKSGGEVDSFYKSMGIRVGIHAKF